MTQEQLFIDREYQVGFSKLENSLRKSDLSTVCDCKGSDDWVAYKLNAEKVLSWLTSKVRSVYLSLLKLALN